MDLLRSLARHRALLWDFVIRDLKARYVGSAMGFFWSLVMPIVNLLVYMVVFQFFLRSRWGDPTSRAETIAEYGDDAIIRFIPRGSGGTEETALIMLAGILVWAAFAETLSRATNSLVENANLIQKVVFPSQILVPYLTLSSMFNMLIGLPIVLIGVIYIDVFGVGWPLVVAPALLVLQCLFTIGVGWLLSVANLYFRDIYHLIGVGLTVWMFSTPIFYPAFLVASSKFYLDDTPDGNGPYIPFTWVLDLNPMYWLIHSWRSILVFNEWPDWRLFARLAVVAIALFLFGAWAFERKRTRIPDLL